MRLYQNETIFKIRKQKFQFEDFLWELRTFFLHLFFGGYYSYLLRILHELDGVPVPGTQQKSCYRLQTGWNFMVIVSDSI